MSGLLTRMYAVFVCVGVFAFANGYGKPYLLKLTLNVFINKIGPNLR